ncbi:helix-turn-helix transcriptional regulator [Clostridium baratii]|uniref:helix-turn-helix transcriptional regulator n=1 Tax=Clostridium baratii TaxID=1561 RepID=UPI0030CAAA2B
MANKEFGNTLRNLRNSKGYTQQQVADMLKLKNKSTLGSWEVGKSEPDGYTLLKLCKIYDVSDIYKTFNETSPQETDSSFPMLNEYSQLNDDYKDLINQQILLLLKIQNKNS